jgi:vacuolar-type H+-ATPase subunit H
MIMAISEAKNIPASGKVIVDREQMLQTLAVIEDRLPEEMRAARWMVREREVFVARTNERVRDLVQRARQKADQMVSDTNIIAEATEEANILVRRAEDHAHRIRLEAEDYVEDRLERLETLLARVLDQIRSMRTELRQTRPQGG